MNISILGSTGSIGTQTLDIARNNPDIKVLGVSAYSDVSAMEKQVREWHPRLACMVDEQAAKDLRIRIGDTDTVVVSGTEGLIEAAVLRDAQTVVTAVVGISGLLPTIEAIKAGKNIALANKETLVAGGHIVTALAEENNVAILPVDSEHSAVFQCLRGCRRHGELKQIILTASGGPFLGKKKEDLRNITPSQALKHPNWNMGAKVTVDSSTLVNKGLEVIEASWLFNVPVDKIRVVVHRQSIVHSMVEFCDNGVIAQLGAPDMRLPIQYALTYPYREPMMDNEFDITKYSQLTFEEPDTDTFFALKLAYDAAYRGGSSPCVFNSADEAAVDLFLKEKIKYPEISEAIAYAMQKVHFMDNPSLEEIIQTDQEARRVVYNKALISPAF